MNEVFEQELIVTPSICDASGRLSCHDCFGVFMDIASIHAKALGVGVDEMAARDLFWLTVKTQITFLERPRMMERVTLRTWPEAPGKVRGNRSYQLLRGDRLLISGKTEWAVTNMKTKQFALMSEVYPPDMTFPEASASDVPFARIPDNFYDCEPFSAYTVRSTDIDVGGHMNNAAYLRAIFGAFSCEALRSLQIGRIDVAFRSPCYEGDRLLLQQKQTDAGLDLRIVNGDAVALLARIQVL